MKAIEISHSSQLDALVERKFPDTIIHGCADAIRCYPEKGADPFQSQCDGFQLGLEIAAAFMACHVKTPKLYEFWLDDDGDFYFAYFIGNVATIRRRLAGLLDRDE